MADALSQTELDELMGFDMDDSAEDLINSLVDTSDASEAINSTGGLEDLLNDNLTEIDYSDSGYISSRDLSHYLKTKKCLPPNTRLSVRNEDYLTRCEVCHCSVIIEAVKSNGEESLSCGHTNTPHKIRL
jgi:hypothetical protein